MAQQGAGVVPWQRAFRTARTVVSSHAVGPDGFFAGAVALTLKGWFAVCVTAFAPSKPKTAMRFAPAAKIHLGLLRSRSRPAKPRADGGFRGRGMAHSWVCVAPKCHSQKGWKSVFSRVSSSGGGLPGRPDSKE